MTNPELISKIQKLIGGGKDSNISNISNISNNSNKKNDTTKPSIIYSLHSIGTGTKNYLPIIFLSLLIFLVFWLFAKILYEYFKKMAKNNDKNNNTKIDIRYY